MTVFKIFRVLFALTFLCSSAELLSAEKRHGSQEEPTEAWDQLQAGNKKFVNNRRFAAERAKLRKEQNPPYVILSCSDSRVPTELVFDQGLGKIFNARVAGNIVDDVVIDSIEFAAANYDVAVIVVLGHTRCGAVVGALHRLRKNHGVIDVQQGHLNAVLIPIEIAIKESGIDIYGPNAVELSIRANIAYSAQQLILQSPSIERAVRDGKLNIVGAEYSLRSGKVKQLFVIDSNNLNPCNCSNH